MPINAGCVSLAFALLPAARRLPTLGRASSCSTGRRRFGGRWAHRFFLSPEICAGTDYKGRPADVWALGVSLYYFIYGELPFHGGTLPELYDSIEAAKVRSRAGSRRGECLGVKLGPIPLCADLCWC